jgi:hypothetical protein
MPVLHAAKWRGAAGRRRMQHNTPAMTSSLLYRGRRASTIENQDLRVTVLEGGGHIAEIVDKRSGVNPLWIPPWPSIEPSTYDAASDTVHGADVEAQLLSGIMGHNLCLDVFGGPSAEEAAAGFGVHGEAPVVTYEIDASAGRLTMQAPLPEARLRVERRIELYGRTVRVREAVENMAATDRPVAWTEHVTLGPPFLEKGQTQFAASATRSKVLEQAFGATDYLSPAAEFDWPLAPTADGGVADLRRFTDAAASSAYTAHLMNPARQDAYFVAFSPRARLAFGYVWRQSDFPWMGIWEENHSRVNPPWNGATLTRGMEFGVSPFAESRRQMIDRGRLFGVPTYRWIPARCRVEVEYWIVTRSVAAIPDALEWPEPG